MIKEIYDCKLEIARNCNIADLQKIIDKESSFDTIDNNDGTLYVDTHNVRVCSDIFDPHISEWIKPIESKPVNYLYSILPLTDTTCIITL